jgi:hypothetical protein
MVWSKYKAATLASLVCASLTLTGLATAQQTGTPNVAVGTKTDEVVTVQEAGKPPQKYKVLKTYRAPNGKNAWEMKNLATGEVTTYYVDDGSAASTDTPIETKAKTPVVNPAPASSTSSGSSRPSLVQWIKNKTGGGQSQDTVMDSQAWTPPPSAIKTQPATSVTHSAPITSTSAKATEQVAAPAPQYRTVEEPGKLPLKCRVMATWHTDQGQKASQMLAVETGEILTIVETSSADGTQAPKGKVTAVLYHWGHNKTPPTGVPVAPMSAFAATRSTTVPQGSTSPAEFVSHSTAGDMIVSDSPRPTVGERVKGWIGGLFGRAPETTSMPTTYYAPSIAETPKSKDTFVASETPKAKNVAKVADNAKSIETAKATEVTSSPDIFKAVETAKAKDETPATDAPKSKEAPKAPDLPAVPNALNIPDSPAAPMVAKSVDMPTPVDAPMATELVKTEDVPAATDVSKMLAAPQPLPNIPPPPVEKQVPANPVPSQMPAVAKGTPDIAPPPPAPTQWVPSKVQTTPLPSMPSLAPAASMPGSQFSANAKDDPLASPESFVPSRIEESMPSNISSGSTRNAGSAQATGKPRVPLGAASVVAAGVASGNNEMPQYLPVPMITVPQAHPPMPPVGAMPPQGAPMMYGNAFPPSMPQGNPAMMGYGYGPIPIGAPMPITPQGYPMPMMAQAYSMPIMMPMQPAMAYANPAMDRPGIRAGGPMSMQQSVEMLMSSIYPTQRETAVEHLCACDWRANPQVVTLLLTTAKEDPAAMVRVAAVSGLARMGVSTEAAIATYTLLKSDVDPRVRLEAEQALVRVVPTAGRQ